jgi:spermidine synthase
LLAPLALAGQNSHLMGKKFRNKAASKPKDGGGSNVPSVSAAAVNDRAVDIQKQKREWLPIFLFGAVAVLFFASGLSSLIYQVVWTRMLVLVFGATSFATATVLAVFMGGLALGSFIAARISDSVKRPLMVYGVLELLIGLWALLTPSLLAAATPIYKTIWLQTHAAIVPFSLLRFVCAGAILLVPTTCMGATLPLLARHVTTGLQAVGSRVGTLYAVNTLGAVVGAVLTGFFLLPSLGVSATILVAALINVFLFIAVCPLAMLHQRFAVAVAVSERQTLVERAPVNETLRRRTFVVLTAFAISGAVAMIYEVCWTRTLLMVIGSTTYAFSLMLSAFLVGIFAGSLVCSRFVDRFQNPLFIFAALQMALAVLTLISMNQFSQVPYFNLAINAAAPLDDNGQMLIRFLLAGSVLVPTTLCLGAIFPVVVKACVDDLASVGRSVGALYSANTLGAIGGAFLAGFVMVPSLGAETTLFAGAFINTAVGLLLIWVVRPVTWIPAAFASICGVVLAVGAALTLGGWDHLLLINDQAQKRQLMTEQFSYKTFESWRDSVHKLFDVKFWADGPCSNVGVIYSKRDKTTILATNGHIDATDGEDVPVQALLAGFPLMIRPNAENVCVVGWGAGQTVGTTTLFPVKSIEAVELEPNVIEASKFFHHVNGKPEEDPRVHIQYNDGRNFLLATNEHFDVIISEPSNPWQAGVCNLFTQEYFQVCKDRLKKDGVLAVWLQNGEIPPADICAVFNAIHKAFPQVVAFLPREGNIILVASESPIKLSYDQVRKWLADPKRYSAYRNVGIDDAAALIARITVASDGIDSMVGGTRANSDDKNTLEFDVGKSYESKLYLKENAQLLSAMAWSPWDQVDWGAMTNRQKAQVMLNVAQDCLNLHRPGLAGGWAEQSLRLQESVPAYRLVGLGYSADSDILRAEGQFSKGLALSPNDKDLLLLRGSARLRMKRYDGARADLQKLLTFEPNNQIGRALLALTYMPMIGGVPYTADELNSAASSPAKTVISLLGDFKENASGTNIPTVLLVGGRANLKLGRLDEAYKYAMAYKQINERDLRGQLLLDDIAKARLAAKK